MQKYHQMEVGIAMNAGEGGGSVGEDYKEFWENQQNVLQFGYLKILEKFERLGSDEDNVFYVLAGHLVQDIFIGIKTWTSTKEALKEIQTKETICACGNPMATACRECLVTEVSFRLRNAGDHTFLDVIDNSSSKKGEVRMIIELHFRAEFEMARASEAYNRLIPEVFVGKVERWKRTCHQGFVHGCQKMHHAWRKRKCTWGPGESKSRKTSSSIWSVDNSMRLLRKPRSSIQKPNRITNSFS